VVTTQLAPTPTCVTATQDDAPPLLLLHDAPFAHCPLGQGCPTAGSVEHVPQSETLPSAPWVLAEQSPSWHCPPVKHEEPEGSDPVPKLHGPSAWSRTGHPPDFTAEAHASSEAEVTEDPGNARAAAQRVAKRPWTRETSLAGGSTLLHEPPKYAWK